MKMLTSSLVEYRGYDVAPFVIEKNRENYEKENIHFYYTPDNWKDIEGGDLIICKDVLQHLNYECINEFIKTVMPKFKYALITNCILPTEKINKEIKTGAFRPLDLRYPPFNIYMKRIYRFPVKKRNEVKYLLLYYKKQKRGNISKDLLKESVERDIVLFKFKIFDFLHDLNLTQPIRKEETEKRTIIHIFNVIRISHKKKK